MNISDTCHANGSSIHNTHNQHSTQQWTESVIYTHNGILFDENEEQYLSFDETEK